MALSITAITQMANYGARRQSALPVMSSSALPAPADEAAQSTARNEAAKARSQQRRKTLASSQARMGRSLFAAFVPDYREY